MNHPDRTQLHSIYLAELIRKRGRIQKSMGHKDTLKVGMLICRRVTWRPLMFPQKEAVLSPCIPFDTAAFFWANTISQSFQRKLQHKILSINIFVIFRVFFYRFRSCLSQQLRIPNQARWKTLWFLERKPSLGWPVCRDNPLAGRRNCALLLRVEFTKNPSNSRILMV